MEPESKEIKGEILAVTYPVDPKKSYGENILRGIITHLEFKKKRDNISYSLDEVLDSIFLTLQVQGGNRCPECIGMMYAYLGLIDKLYNTNLCQEMPPVVETPCYGLFVPPVRIVEHLKNKQKKDWKWVCSAAEDVNCPTVLKGICYSVDTNKIIKRPTPEEIRHIQNYEDEERIIGPSEAYYLALDKLKRFETEWDIMVKKDAKEIEKMLLEEDESEK